MKPEKIVEQKIYAVCFQLGMSIEIYDSKGSYSEKQGRYAANHGVNNGTPDILGCDRFGQFVAIELKAPKGEKLCSLDQWNFLKKKIDHNGFCLVVSNPDTLKEVYSHWLTLDPNSRRDYLKYLLPKKVYITQIVMGKRVRRVISAPEP